MREIALSVIVAVLALPAPSAIAIAIGDEMGLGDARIDLGRGCRGTGGCHPEAYAWVAARACVEGSGALLVAERIGRPAPPIVVPMEIEEAPGEGCPRLARGSVEIWSDLVSAPAECLRGTVLAQGVAVTRTACFS